MLYIFGRFAIRCYLSLCFVCSFVYCMPQKCKIKKKIMKYNRFVYVAVIEVILTLFSWIRYRKIHIITQSSNWWRWWYSLDLWHYLRRRTNRGRKQTMYEFRPFELRRCDYKNYLLPAGHGRGINFYPKARSGHRIVVSETDLFCFGGYNPDISNPFLFQELWKFNILTQKWSKVFTPNTEQMPKELVSNAVAMKDDVIVVFGGTGFPFGDKRSNKTYLLWPYAVPKQISMLETTGDKPDPQYGQAIMLRDNFLYVIGGTTGHEYTCDIYRLNLTNRAWECCYLCNENSRDDPKGRYRHEIAYDDNFIYILGGGTKHHSFDLETVPAYDLNESKWIFAKTKPDPNADETNGGYPAPRKFHSCVQQSTDDGAIEVVIAGGFKSEDAYFDDIWKLNLQTLQWTRFGQTRLPYALYFHDAATTGNGLMLVFGGITSAGPRTNDLHKMWVKIPKLSEMCWDAMMHYNPLLTKMEMGQLLRFGVPQNFAERAVRGQNVVCDF